jgi:hypothetical protein
MKTIDTVWEYCAEYSRRRAVFSYMKET